MRIVRGTRKDSGGGAQESLESWVSTDKKRYKHTYIKQQQLGTKVFTSVLMGWWPTSFCKTRYPKEVSLKALYPKIQCFSIDFSLTSHNMVPIFGVRIWPSSHQWKTYQFTYVSTNILIFNGHADKHKRFYVFLHICTVGKYACIHMYSCIHTYLVHTLYIPCTYLHACMHACIRTYVRTYIIRYITWPCINLTLRYMTWHDMTLH